MFKLIKNNLKCGWKLYQKAKLTRRQSSLNPWEPGLMARPPGLLVNVTFPKYSHLGRMQSVWQTGRGGYALPQVTLEVLVMFWRSGALSAARRTCLWPVTNRCFASDWATWLLSRILMEHHRYLNRNWSPGSLMNKDEWRWIFLYFC